MDIYILTFHPPYEDGKIVATFTNECVALAQAKAHAEALHMEEISTNGNLELMTSPEDWLEEAEAVKAKEPGTRISHSEEGWKRDLSYDTPEGWWWCNSSWVVSFTSNDKFETEFRFKLRRQSVNACIIRMYQRGTDKLGNDIRELFSATFAPSFEEAIGHVEDMAKCMYDDEVDEDDPPIVWNRWFKESESHASQVVMRMREGPGYMLRENPTWEIEFV